MKHAVKYTLMVSACFACAVCFVLLLALPWIIGGFINHIQDRQIRNDTFQFVLENKDTIQLSTTTNYQEFIFTTTGSWDTYVEYGYYYSADDTYEIKATKENKHKKDIGLMVYTAILWIGTIQKNL